jgi:G:T-mismatch repair DNA endonuclease (very short patch repair protein)
MGAVKQPLTFQASGPVTLLEALTRFSLSTLLKIIQVQGCFWHQHCGCPHAPNAKPGNWELSPQESRNSSAPNKHLYARFV